MAFIDSNPNQWGKPPLFAIHILGEGFNHFRLLSKYLGPEQPIYGLHYGLASLKTKSGQGHKKSIKNLASLYIKEMQIVQPEGPYFIIGACLGGNIAFEMAQQLKYANEKVQSLVLLDAFAPEGRKLLPIHRQLTSIIKGIQKIGFMETVSRIKENIMYLLDESGSEYVQDDVSYKPYPGDVILFHASNRRVTLRYELNPKLGWDRIVTGKLDIYDFPGDHLDIVNEPNINILADRLKDCINKGLKNQ